MITDGTGWHRSELLIIPNNMRLVKLSAYSPELNPVEHIWDDLREKSYPITGYNFLADFIFFCYNGIMTKIFDLPDNHHERTRKNRS